MFGLKSAPVGGVVLDVDGSVISPSDLVRRVEELLQSTDAAGVLQSPAHRDNEEEQSPAGVVQHVHAMRALQAALHPPDVGPAAGIRGRAARFTKRAVRKLASWYVEPRWRVQQDFDHNNVEFASAVYNELFRLERELEVLRRRNTALRLQVVSASEREHQIQKAFMASVTEHLRMAANQDDVHRLRDEVSRVLERVGAASASGADIDYVAFEDRFRGYRYEVRESQEHYVAEFPPAEVAGRILDIGCGRGEMLELLRRAGHDVLGVDPDPDMVASCRAKGLPVVQDDGIHQLAQVDNDALKGVFCAQVIEHLLTSELEQLVRLALQKLRVGGILIMETINPRSLFAVGNHFYADTSHIRPVHPETLRFICEQVGFSSVQLQELSPHPLVDLADDLPPGNVGAAVEELLRNVFGFQDYAIIATK